MVPLIDNPYLDDSIWGFEQDGFDPLDYRCPKCGPWGEFIHDSGEMEYHGFSKSTAPNGICIKCAQLDQDAHLTSSDYFELDKFAKNSDGHTNASLLEFKPLSQEEKDELVMLSPQYDVSSNKNAKYRIKSLYRSAIREYRYQMMDPPYFVGNRLNLFKPDIDESTKPTETGPEKYTFISTENDWFLRLFPSFRLLESHLRNDVSSRQKPNRLAYALISTYLHKHWDFNNVEPLWVFMKRMRVGNKQIIKRLDSWIVPTPDYHIAQINSLSNAPTPETVKNLIVIISKHAKDIRLNEMEIESIRNKSLEIYQKLLDKKITNPLLVRDSPESLLEHLNSKFVFTGSIKINDLPFHASGMIEALCVNQAAYDVLDHQKARNLEKKFLFPKDNGNPWWRQELSSDARNIIDRFSKMSKLL